MMGYWKWVGQRIKNIFTSNMFIIMFPYLIGSLITMYFALGQIWWEFWMFIPMIVGLIGTILLGTYDIYLFEKELEKL